jgi:hypothetical protein
MMALSSFVRDNIFDPLNPELSRVNPLSYLSH